MTVFNSLLSFLPMQMDASSWSREINFLLLLAFCSPAAEGLEKDGHLYPHLTVGLQEWDGSEHTHVQTQVQNSHPCATPGSLGVWYDQYDQFGIIW